MKSCPITYETTEDNQNYSRRGLAKLSHRLKDIQPFNDKEIITNHPSDKEQIVVKGSLKISKNTFVWDDKKGKYLLKLQHPTKKNLPENQDLSLKIAKTVGIETPLHGLIYNQNQQLIHFILSPDSKGRNNKLHFENFAQLLQKPINTNETASYEELIHIIEQHTTFPQIEKIKLFKLLLLSFLIGNNTLNLQNLALIKRNNKTELSPLYNAHNAYIYNQQPEMELGLLLNDKAKGFIEEDFLFYFANNKLSLNSTVISKILQHFNTALNEWFLLIEKSLLPQEHKDVYYSIINSRLETLQL